MSQMSPAWQQSRRTPGKEPPEDTLYTSSSDSDSGCPREEIPGIATDFTPVQVTPTCLKEAAVADVRSLCRLRALLCQLPPQDSDVRYCSALGEEEGAALQRFCAWRRLESLGQGLVRPASSVHPGSLCERCGQRIHTGGWAVLADRHGGTSRWHPSCFVCCTCEEPLLDLIYFHHDRKIYCGRHHAELFRPRCASCDQLIFTEELTEAEGWHWHIDHFCCSDCDVVLGGQRYVMKGGQPYCCACFQSSHADSCESCGDAIGVDCERVTHQGRHWHAGPSCFRCDRCQRPLLAGEFLPHGDLLLCSVACSSRADSSSSDSSDSAFLSAPSPITHRPVRGGGHVHRTQTLVNRVCETRNQRARGTKIKMAQSNGRFLLDGDRRTSPRRTGERGANKDPCATERPSEEPHDHPCGDDCRTRGPDLLWTTHSQDDGDSRDCASEECHQAPATARGHERMSGEPTPRQEPPDDNSSPTRGPSPAQNIRQEDVVTLFTRSSGSLKLSRHQQYSGPPSEDTAPSSPIQHRRHTMQPHRSPGSSRWRKQRRSKGSSTASIEAQSKRTEAPLRESQGLSTERNLPDQETILPTSSDQEDSWCHSCSSSSDSEQEGFFLGRPIPSIKEGPPISEKASRLRLKDEPRSKNCTLS